MNDNDQNVAEEQSIGTESKSEKPVKQKKDSFFFILGLLSLFFVATLCSLISSTSDIKSSEPIAIIIVSVFFFLALGSFLIGKKMNIVKLWSYGAGGLWSFVVGLMIVAMLYIPASLLTRQY